MCSQRTRAANRMPSLRREVRSFSEEGTAGSLSCGTLAAILDRGGFDLDIALEFLGERRAGERHPLANALIRPVFSRGLDEDGVLAARERLALVVLAVPGDGVLAGGAGRLPDRVGHVLLLETAAG